MRTATGALWSGALSCGVVGCLSAATAEILLHPRSLRAVSGARFQSCNFSIATTRGNAAVVGERIAFGRAAGSSC